MQAGFFPSQLAKLTCFAVALGVALALVPHLSWAHDRGTAYSRWRLNTAPPKPSAEVTVDFPWMAIVPIDPDRLSFLRPETLASDPAATAQIDAALIESIGAAIGDQRCEPTIPPAPVPAAPGRLARRWSMRCPGGGPISIIVAHPPRGGGPVPLVHLARVELDDRVGDSASRGTSVPRSGPRILEHAFGPGASTWQLSTGVGSDGAPRVASGDTLGGSLSSFLGLGIKHILSGPDHLLFLCGLLLVGTGLGELVRVVTGFTVAHSITLAVSVLGMVHPPGQAVEAAIGLSIVIVALDYFTGLAGPLTRRRIVMVLGLGIASLALGRLTGRVVVPLGVLLGLGGFSIAQLELVAVSPSPARSRWLCAFAFGLVHGLGFAGGLIELDLPRASLARALVGFNLGVECGQLAFVTTIMLAGIVLRERLSSRLRGWILDISAGAVLAAGSFWLVSRALGTPP